MNSTQKLVKKPWGAELWIADGTDTPYALKKIFFQAGNKTSLQVHKHKIETNYVLDGTGILLIAELQLDIDRYLCNEYTINDMQVIIDSMEAIPLREGVSQNVYPGYLHRVIAVTDLTFMEASTSELDDVIRIQDDTHRAHGKIHSEHE
jgi:hypothetical protein